MAIKLSRTASDLLREIMDKVVSAESGVVIARVVICGQPGQCMLVELTPQGEPGQICVGFRYGGVLTGEKMRKLREFLFLEFDLMPKIINCSQWVCGTKDEVLAVLKAVAEKFLTSTDYEAGAVADIRHGRGESLIYILGTDRRIRRYVIRGLVEELRLRRKFRKKLLELRLASGGTVTLPLSDSEEPLVKAIVEGEFLT